MSVEFTVSIASDSEEYASLDRKYSRYRIDVIREHDAWKWPVRQRRSRPETQTVRRQNQPAQAGNPYRLPGTLRI
ncbi:MULTISPECIES: hypothetical protein [Mumia]|uniref:hypothetical protein n=1 Tax=Mumia TaxID=1546255 RepID=UPI0013D26D6E|nr:MULTISPECIES: hypothetical protein [Mumia]